MDVPLVLNAIPRVRGQSKDEIVEELLTHTTEMVNLNLVMMDREFDSKPVKKTCEEYGVRWSSYTYSAERSSSRSSVSY